MAEVRRPPKKCVSWEGFRGLSQVIAPRAGVGVVSRCTRCEVARRFLTSPQVHMAQWHPATTVYATPTSGVVCSSALNISSQSRQDGRLSVHMDGGLWSSLERVALQYHHQRRPPNAPDVRQRSAVVVCHSLLSYASRLGATLRQRFSAERTLGMPHTRHSERLLGRGSAVLGLRARSERCARRQKQPSRRPAWRRALKKKRKMRRGPWR